MNGWTNTRDEMPPDDHQIIELRFGSDPIPLKTSGRMVHTVYTSFGPPVVLLYWRFAGIDD